MSKTLKVVSELVKQKSDAHYQQNTREAEFRSFDVARKELQGDLASAMDCFFIANPLALHEFNKQVHDDNKKNSTKRDGLSYSLYNEELQRMVATSNMPDEEKEEMQRSLKIANIRAAGDLDTVTKPGFGNALQTTVGDYFMKTVEELGTVYQTVTKRNMVNSGNFQQPVYSNFGRSQFVNAGSAYPDAGSDIEGGSTEVTLNPKPFGNNLDVFNDFQWKLSPAWLKEITDILAERHAREKDYTILFGTSSIPDYPTGMVNGAGAITGLTPAGDPFETLGKYINAISQARRVSRNKMVLYMNESQNQRFIDLKYAMTNNDLSQMISLDSDGNISKIRGVKAVTTDVIPVDNGTSSLVIGVPSLYLWGYSKPDTIVDDGGITGFKSDTLALKVSGMADGKPGFGNAFGNFDMTDL